MAKFLNKKIMKDVFSGFLATFLIGFGVSIYIKCQIGSDGLTVFLDGINTSLGISIPVADQFVTLSLFAFAYLMNKKNIGICTLLSVLLIGSCIVIAEGIIQPIPFSEFPLYMKIIAVVFAQLTMSTGSALLQSMPSGKSIYDAFIFGISEKLEIQYVSAFVIYGLSFMSIGLLLGGKIGIGTIVYISLGGFFTSHIKELLIKQSY